MTFPLSSNRLLLGFAGFDFSTEVNPYEFNFAEEVFHEFVLYAYNGCREDTATLPYLIEYEKGLYVLMLLPNEIEYGLKKFNAVTGLLEYHIMVFQRGNIVWESDKINDKGNQ